MEAITRRLEAIATRNKTLLVARSYQVEAIAIGLEAIATGNKKLLVK